jgi:hypothetical protein
MTDAEAELRAAIDAGDRAEIERLGAIVDSLDVKPEPAPLLGSALWYAEQGLHVFPLQPGTKIPFKGSHGCKDATTNPEQIRAWWARTPDANLAIATGFLVDVVDIDGPTGQRERIAHWDDIFAKVDADNLGKVLTPRRGGMHIYVPATGDGNATGIVTSVDYRGVGGYVVAPPSRTEQGSYRWLGSPNLANLNANSAA